MSCSYVMMMPFKRQALVEFSELQSADRCVSSGAKDPVYIAGGFGCGGLTAAWSLTRLHLLHRTTSLL